MPVRVAFIGGFAFNPKGTMRARAHPLAVELVRMGHEVTIFLPPYDNLADSGRVWHLEGVRIWNAGNARELVPHPRDGAGRHEYVFRHNSNTRITAKAWRYSKMLVQLIRGVKRYHPDVIHVFKPKGFAGAAGTYFLLRKHPPVVLDCDDWEGWGGWNDVKSYPWIVKEYIDRQERWMMRRAAVVTVASRVLQERAATLRGRKNNIYYVPNCGPSTNNRKLQDSIRGIPRDVIRRELQLAEAPAILFSGHIEDQQGLEFFARTAGPVANELGATIVFIGYDPLKTRLNDLFCTYPKANVVLFPRLEYPDFLKAVHACDVIAFPYSDHPIYRAKCSARILDYMIIAKPVLTSDVGQNHEYIIDEESGLLAASGDDRDFADKLQRLLHNPNWAERLGENARRRISEQFAWSGESLGQCVTAYGQVLSGDCYQLLNTQGSQGGEGAARILSPK